jgi:hypothetical protein
MDTLIFGLMIVGLTAAFDLLAIRFGADSCDGIGDDHARPANSLAGRNSLP